MEERTQLGLSCNLSVMYAELPFAGRFAAAAGDGFRCIELWVPEDREEMVRQVREHDLAVSALNVSPGPGRADLGRLADPSCRSWWRTEAAATFDLAAELGSGAVNLLAGRRLPIGRRAQFEAILHNLEWALEHRPAETTLLLEPLNPVGRPDYVLRTVEDVIELRSALGDPDSLRLLFDVHHLVQIYDASAVELLWRWQHLIGHVQVADVPGRREPGSGAIDFKSFFRALAASSYDGWVGLEYVPSSGDTRASLGWLSELRGLVSGDVGSGLTTARPAMGRWER